MNVIAWISTGLAAGPPHVPAPLMTTIAELGTFAGPRAERRCARRRDRRPHQRSHARHHRQRHGREQRRRP